MNTGGIVGQNDEGVVMNSTNNAEIVGENIVGGIVGDNDYRRNSDGSSIILNCSNSGKVVSLLTCGNSYVGGIAGSSSSAVKEGRTVIMQCNNTGALEGSVYIGGICGFQGDGNGGDTSYIKKCWNSGSIKSKVYGDEHTAIIYSFAGGIVGRNNCGFIDECYNTGNVEGLREVGGISGGNSGIITDSYNSGIIKGVIDYEKSSKYQLEKVSSSSASGIVGVNWSIIENCYNTGKVVADDASGLVSSNDDVEGTIQNCYTVGNIEGSKTSDIIGLHLRNNK